MIKPMPFCPSFEPCAKDTAVQVKISRPRIQPGGAFLASGGVYSVLLLTKAFIASSSRAEPMKPTTGLNSSALNTPPAWLQSTPETPEPGSAISWFARPTPMIEPTSVWDELFGRPKYQVPRFHTIAAINSEKIIAKPAPELACRISSTGSRLTTAKATAPDDVSTPRKLNAPDQTTATCAGMLCV